MQKIQIKDWRDNKVIYEITAFSIKEAVEKAIKEKVSLAYADLSYADLSYANLHSANLCSANLFSANLSYANLSSANLSSADLRYANLSSADLRFADLNNVEFCYANLGSANLMTFEYDKHRAYYTFDGVLRIGCHLMPISEWLIGYKEIGKSEKYTPKQIKEYGAFIKRCAKHFKNSTKVIHKKDDK